MKHCDNHFLERSIEGLQEPRKGGTDKFTPDNYDEKHQFNKKNEGLRWRQLNLENA